MSSKYTAHSKGETSLVSVEFVMLWGRYEIQMGTEIETSNPDGPEGKKGSAATPNSKNYNRTPAPLFRPNRVGSILKHSLKMPMLRYQMASR